MKTNANQNTSTIYYRPLKQWIEVTPEQKRDWERFVGATRKANQRAGACCIPYKKSYKCDGLCDTCEFRCIPKDAPQHLSIDTEMENACENGVSRTSFLADNRLTTEIDIDSLILNGLLSELQASDPESYEIFIAIADGLSERASAERLHIYCASASQMFGVPVEKHGVNGHLRQKGKIAELALGYGGSVGALKAMGALEMGLSEDELPALVSAWRQANPKIVQFWWAVDRAVMDAVTRKTTTKTHGIIFSARNGMLFITLPSGRSLAYVKPKIGENRFGGDCITYEGVGGTKKWERLDSYGPKFVENIVQAISRDILCYAMRTLRCCSIVMHIHDEVVIEADRRMSLQAVCDQMGRTPPWAKGLQLRADGYETDFYKKD